VTLAEIFDLDRRIETEKAHLQAMQDQVLLDFFEREDVRALQQAIQDLADRRTTLIAEARSREIYSEGSYVLKVAKRMVRTVVPALFAEKFGFDLFCKVVTVPVGAAEKVVGKAELEDCCNTEVKELGATVELVTERTAALRKKKGWS